MWRAWVLNAGLCGPGHGFDPANSLQLILVWTRGFSVVPKSTVSTSIINYSQDQRDSQFLTSVIWLLLIALFTEPESAWNSLGISKAFYSCGIQATVTIMLWRLPSASFKPISNNKVGLEYSHSLYFLFLNCCLGFWDCCGFVCLFVFPSSLKKKLCLLMSWQEFHCSMHHTSLILAIHREFAPMQTSKWSHFVVILMKNVPA